MKKILISFLGWLIFLGFSPVGAADVTNEFIQVIQSIPRHGESIYQVPSYPPNTFENERSGSPIIGMMRGKLASGGHYMVDWKDGTITGVLVKIQGQFSMNQVAQTINQKYHMQGRYARHAILWEYSYGGKLKMILTRDGIFKSF